MRLLIVDSDQEAARLLATRLRDLNAGHEAYAIEARWAGAPGRSDVLGLAFADESARVTQLLIGHFAPAK